MSEDARRAGLDLAQDVRREDDRVLAAELADERAHLADLVGVEARGGLVEDDDRRPRDDGVREADALAVALGQVADALVRDVEDARLSHRVVDARARARARGRA